MSDSEDPIEPIDEGGDDLFGDEGSDADNIIDSPQQQAREDDDLASDPEGDTYARYRGDDDGRQQDDEVRERIIEVVTAYRHPIPKPSDGSLRALRVPSFIKFLPLEYKPDSFVPSEHDINNARLDHPQHVVRFRRDESTNRLHSNTNILRWSDGSITISVGGEQYEIQKKALAPPAGKPYNELHDGHYYAAAAELTSNMLMTVGHVTEQFNVRPSKEIGDDALNLLADRMAKATKARDSDMIIRTTVDPELQKRHAEQLEKDRMKAQRRQENAKAKQDVGLGRPGRGGLSIGALEGGRRDGGRKRGAPGAGQPKRRRPEYDSDDDLPHGVGRQENYDLDDGFLVGSDEEEMDSEAEDEEEDVLDDDEDERPPPRSKRQRTAEPSEEEDRDASGEEEEPMPEASQRHRRRNVVDDDDE